MYECWTCDHPEVRQVESEDDQVWMKVKDLPTEIKMLRLRCPMCGSVSYRVLHQEMAEVEKTSPQKGLFDGEQSEAKGPAGED
jgi:Zn finger protein HypA/HybF involved in hydrogenase expression